MTKYRIFNILCVFVYVCAAGSGSGLSCHPSVRLYVLIIECLLGRKCSNRETLWHQRQHMLQTCFSFRVIDEILQDVQWRIIRETETQLGRLCWLVWDGEHKHTHLFFRTLSCEFSWWWRGLCSVTHMQSAMLWNRSVFTHQHPSYVAPSTLVIIQPSSSFIFTKLLMLLSAENWSLLNSQGQCSTNTDSSSYDGQIILWVLY